MSLADFELVTRVLAELAILFGMLFPLFRRPP
jgi:hypothetical protein